MSGGELNVYNDRLAWVVMVKRYGQSDVFVCADAEAARHLCMQLLRETVPGVDLSSDTGVDEVIARLRHSPADISMSVLSRPTWVYESTPLEELDACCNEGARVSPGPGHGDSPGHRSPDG